MNIKIFENELLAACEYVQELGYVIEPDVGSIINKSMCPITAYCFKYFENLKNLGITEDINNIIYEDIFYLLPELYIDNVDDFIGGFDDIFFEPKESAFYDLGVKFRTLFVKTLENV